MNYGINLINPIYNRVNISEGEPEMAALKMAVNGILIVLNVSPVMGEAWERRITDLGYSS